MRSHVLQSLGIGLSFCITVAAWPQGALDASLQVGSSGKNAGKQQEDYRSRNLVVTGDVAAGRGFRGSVGYSAEGDFRGATGGDSSIGFRRNSALSSAAIARTTSTGDAFSMARDSTALEYRRDFVGASSTGQTGAATSSAETSQRLDRMSTQLSGSRQRSAEVESTVMATYKDREGDTGVLTASTLRGVKKERNKDRVGSDRLSLYEASRLRDDLRFGRIQHDAVVSAKANPFLEAAPTDSVNVSGTREMKLPTQGDIASQSAGTGLSAYDTMLRGIRTKWIEQVAVRPSTDQGKTQPESGDQTEKESAQRGLSSAYDALRVQLDRGVEPAGLAGTTVVQSNRGVSPSDLKPTDDGKVSVGDVRLTLDDYALLLKHGTQMNAYGDGMRGRLDELLLDGQRSMHLGNSFLAEKQFEVALAISPGDPRATAGLLHCQIAGNLIGSAATTLEALLVDHPEMMDVKWAPEAIPTPDRLAKAMASCRASIQAKNDEPSQGLLLAYIGHLTGDSAAIREGLQAMQGSPQHESRAALLSKLWIDSPPASPDSPKPAAP